MIEIRNDLPLAPFTTFKVGGTARKFVKVSNIEELQQALEYSRQEKLPIFILAGGSNLIVSSKGFDGLVIKAEFSSQIISHYRIISGSGVTMAAIVSASIESGLSGLEWAGGLPGSLGGAVRGNAGAFGGEIKDIVESVVSVDLLSGKTIARNNRQCNFGYRTSIFKQKAGEIIVSVSLKLRQGDTIELKKIANSHITYRQDKHPMDMPSAGSVFKNIPVEGLVDDVKEKYKSFIKTDPFPVIPVAKIIADCGLAGRKIGGAQISEKHTNYIVNTGKTTPEDIVELIKEARRVVRKKFGIILEIEQELVGF